MTIPVDVVDAVGGKPHLRSGQERGGGGALLIGQGFGVSEPGEPVDDGVQVDVAALRAADFALSAALA